MGRLPIITESVDPRPKRLVNFLRDYTLLRETAGFTIGSAQSVRVPSDVPKRHVQLNMLSHKLLKSPLDVFVEPDASGFLARTPDLPLFGYGQDCIEAIDMLKQEIEALFDELMEDPDLSEEWLHVKEYLRERIAS